MKTCVQCAAQFAILEADKAFYQNTGFPEPQLCPDCRHQRRTAYRNERVLYKQNCDLCKKSVVTVFSGVEPFPVYCPECWWGDRWDSRDYGREFDFSRPFFDQFHELQNVVPRLSLNNPKHENSGYCNQCTGNKNSYLLFGSDDNEDSMYGSWINRCVDTYNSSNLADCTLCFDLIDSENCYGCVYSQDLRNCNNCYFSFDLIGCQDCIGSAGLRNKKYYIFNEPYTKEAYRKKFESFSLGSYESYLKFKQQFPDIQRKIPHKYIHIINSENCIGDYILNSKNCHYCFDIFDAEDCRYSFNLVHQHFNTFDASYVTELRNAYEVMSSIGENIYCCSFCWYGSNTWYSDLALHCHHVLGCVGMKHRKHCILNKQYSPEEFETLRSRIIEHMKKTGEWGNYFPIRNSIYAYNETVAQDYFPMTKEQVMANGWKWKDEDRKEFKPATAELPDQIQDVPQEITAEVLACTGCGKNYRILEKELQTYRNMNLPLPRQCPECRFQERMGLRNPRRLYRRTCQKCGVGIQTTYDPSRAETVYCESCYLKDVDSSIITDS